MDLKDIKETIEEADDNHGLIESLGEYLNTRIEILKLRGIKTSSDVVSTFASYALLLLFGTVFFLILNIALGYYLGEILGKTYYGFLAVAGFYFVLIIILALLRKRLFKKPIANALISKLND